jgi:CRP/FNR family cyclic AMP-dependent transcriptional regulator
VTTLSDRSQLATSLAGASAEAVRVLQADPDLGAGVASEDLALATGASIAPVITLDRGPWTFAPPAEPGGLGGLVLDGLILIRVEVGDRCHGELLGEGDLVSPWIQASPEWAECTEVSARIMRPVEMAMLDRQFALRTARWPEIHAALMRRLVLRSRRLSLQSAINSIPRTQQRLELTLWQLAYRFGRVTSEGLRLHLPVSHAQLAEIVATQRPSVTIALARLQQAGRLVRTGTHDWLLTGGAPPELEPLTLEYGVGARAD